MATEKVPTRPQFVDDHIYSSWLSDRYEIIYDKLDDVQSAKLNKLLWKVYNREIRIGEFYHQAGQLGLPDFEKKLWPEILRYDFFPLADYLGLNVKDAMKYLNAEELGALQVKNLSAAIDEALAVRKVSLPEEARKHLLGHIEKMLAGEETEDETVALSAKPVGFGGAEMDIEKINDVLDTLLYEIINFEGTDRVITAQSVTQEMVQQQLTVKKVATAKKDTVRVVGAPTREVGVSVLKPAPPPMPKPVKKASAVKADVPTTSVGIMEEELPSVMSTGPRFVPPIQQYDAMAERLISQSGVKVPTDLAQRFKILVISRLKDVRKAGETLERLQADPLNGGLGLNKAEAEKIINSMEGERAKEGELKTPPSLPKIIKEPELEVKEISEPKVETPFIAPRPAAPPPPKSTTSDIKRIQPTAIKIIPQPAKQQARVEFADIPKTAPEPAKPKPTMAIPQTVAGKAKVEDVAYRPRLLGPVEELREMTLLDFHRLSPKVKVAVDKIYAKMELLGKEGYDRRIKGMQAWQESPINKLYSSILNESLKRLVPVSKVIEERAGRQKETLTLEEFKHTVQLNKNLGL